MGESDDDVQPKVIVPRVATACNTLVHQPDISGET